MKQLILSAFLLIASLNWLSAQDSNCSRQTSFGTADICLPIIEGYQECYSIPIVKNLADATELPDNEILGFYLNDEVYAIKDSIGLISFDDYFKVYATKQLANQPSNEVFLQEIKEFIGSEFITENWDLMKNEIDNLGLDIEVGVPRVINSYDLDDKSFTYVMVTKYNVPDAEPYTLVMTMNGILVNDRIIWMAHYLNFIGDESVQLIQEKSNSILTEFQKVNGNGK